MSTPGADADPKALNVENDERALRQETLRFLTITCGVAGFGWGVYYRILFDVGDAVPTPAWIVPMGMLAVAVASGWLAKWNAPVAGVLFPIQLLLVLLAFLPFTAAEGLAPFYLVPIVALASLTCPRRWTLPLTMAALAMLLAASQLIHGSITMPYRVAAMVSLFTAGIAWLATRNLYTAVQWAMFSHNQAMQSVEALRERRGELRRLSDMLSHNQDRLHYLNLRLEQAKVAAEEAYRTKQHFVANVSHELRTPLNLIAGFSEMMAFSPESYGGVRLPAQYQEDVMEIYRASKHLLGLVEDVLALAQLEAGQMIVHREWSSLAEVLWDATETMRSLYETKGLALQVEVPPDLPLMYIDAGRIRQVLLNLLNNAHRFTEQGSVCVQVRCESQEVVLMVRDTGIGIAEEDLPHVFEEFHSLSKGPSARRGGFGLGLAISRRLIEAHGGRLWVESQVGLGSCFFIALPYAEMPVASRPTLVRTAPPRETEATRPVLLAVGENGGHESLDRYLESYRVVHTAPAEALAAYEQYLPTAVWLQERDVERGAPSYLAPLLRAAPDLPVIHCPVPTGAEIARKLQADYFLPKPITREQLARTLAALSEEEPIRSALIVDDDPRMVHMLHRLLDSIKELSCRVSEACGGKEGLELLAEEKPDLLLLDLLMPEVSGYDLLEQSRHMAHDGRHMRIILMSGVELDQATLPVHAISVHNQRGFSLPQSLKIVNLIAKELSGRIVQTQ